MWKIKISAAESHLMIVSRWQEKVNKKVFEHHSLKNLLTRI